MNKDEHTTLQVMLRKTLGLLMGKIPQLSRPRALVEQLRPQGLPGLGRWMRPMWEHGGGCALESNLGR